MRLRTRLWISFLMILIFPLAMFAVTGTILLDYQINAIEKVYGVTINRDFLSMTPISVINRTAEDLQKQMLKEVHILDETEYWENWDSQLMEEDFNLVVAKEGEVLFYSDAVKDLIEELSIDSVGVEEEEYENKLLRDNQIFVRQQNFKFEDGSVGSLFLISNMNMGIPEIQGSFIKFIVLIVLIMALTAAGLTIWIYNSIVKPLGTLKKAANNIKEGNLDFTIEGNSDDEIGQLCSAFEEMRIRLKETTEEKLEADAQNKELISNISHDLKTPITAIKGYVEGLRDGIADTPEKRERYIKTIYTKANDMDRLIDELTFYSRVDSNRIPYKFERLNVCGYFDDCAEEKEMELASRNIDFQYANFCENDALIIADAEQLRRVINNIISNSVKYIDKPKKKINLTVKDTGDFIQVEIEDNGIGISKKDLGYIFDRFYRTDTSRNSSKGGSGIGLSIVKKIIEDHGGKVWATSKEGTGTVMHFVLRKYVE